MNTRSPLISRAVVRRTNLLAVVAICAAALAGGPALAAAPAASVDHLNELSNAFAQVAEQASPAVVFVQVEKELRGGVVPQTPFDMFPDDFLDRFFGRRWQRPQTPQAPQQRTPKGRRVPMGQGTGFIISPDGYIVTNHHVVGEADRVRVKLADGREFDAETVGSDPQTEIALIKIDASGLPALALGDSDQLKVGEWVLAIGNPFGLSHTVTAGIVSAKGRGNVGITDYADFIQTDAAINPGNSGGPLLNLKGEAVGLNTAIFTRSGGYMGIGFAIPINMVRFVQEQLQDNGTITRGFLGVVIQNLTPELAEWFGIEEGKGVLIAEVSKDSPAEAAGLQRDDVIVEFDGQPVAEIGSFRSRVASTTPGTKAPLVVLRDGKRVKKTVKVGSLDSEAQVATLGSGSEDKKLGLTVQNLTDDIAERLGYKDESGVVVSDVEQGSVAANAGVKAGVLIKEVNRQAVRNTREFQDAVKNSEAGKTVLLLVVDGEYSHYVALRLEE